MKRVKGTKAESVATIRHLKLDLIQVSGSYCFEYDYATLFSRVLISAILRMRVRSQKSFLADN